MTEREKMINGALYDPSDPELEQLRLNARKLARKYNRTDEDQPEEQAEFCENYCLQQSSFRICRHRSTLITAAIRTLESTALPTLISPA